MSDYTKEQEHKALLDKHITIPTLQAKIAELEAEYKVLRDNYDYWKMYATDLKADKKILVEGLNNIKPAGTIGCCNCGDNYKTAGDTLKQIE